MKSGYAKVESRIHSPSEQYLMDHGWKPGTPQQAFHTGEEDTLSQNDEAFIENYSDIGYVENPGGHNDTHASGQILADGRPAGEFVVRLLPRQQYNNRHGGFFGMCDAISADVQDSSIRFFTDKGRCTRVSSVGDSLNENSDNEEMKALLYVEKFSIDEPVYRTATATSTGVTSKALRSLLEDTWYGTRRSVGYNNVHCKRRSGYASIFSS